MKPLLAVFAHPDDEAFGPSGRIAVEAKKRDVYLVAATNGDAGENSTKSKKELSEIRRSELRNSAKILGVKKVYFLDFEDGCLCNKAYHNIASKINIIIEETQADSLLTFEPKGVSGHLDHIAISMICTYLYEKNERIQSLIYYCGRSRESKSEAKDYFIYFPEGYKKNEVDEVLDVAKVWEQKIESMNAHRSQRHDYERVIEIIESLPKEEFFLTKTKIS